MTDFDGTVRLDVKADTRPLAAAFKDLEGLADRFGRAMTIAFRRSALEGRRLQDVLRGLALDLSRRAFHAALAPVERGIGRLFGALASRLFAGIPGGVARFARGGIVRGPAAFPLAGGLGLMGEAGAEAVLPLARGPDGRLGVRAEGGAPAVSVTFNVTTPDAGSFRRAEAEIAAMLARAVARGSRGM